MSEQDISENLKTYKLQLQQVEASLTTDPDNEDLLKLKKDLQEVIDLTTELLVGKLTAQSTSAGASVSLEDGDIDPSLADEHSWNVGDKCSAIYSEDGLYYDAVIEEILEDGTCTITFEEYGNTDVTQVTMLKPLDPSMSLDGDGKPQSKKDLAAKQREYKRKKAQKKAQRMKMLEEEREQEKSKWQSFNAKTFSKTNKGRVKKSIFATPDSDKGKVGVGTCGVGGKPMTAYQHQEKWKK